MSDSDPVRRPQRVPRGPDAADTVMADWIEQQFAEDERVARLASHAQGGSAQWRYDSFRDPDYGTAHGLDIGERTISAVVGSDDPLRPEELRHIARHDPATELRRIAANRRLLAGHTRRVHRCDGGDIVVVDEDCPIKVALAAPYAGEPGYRTEWKP